jgi:hypothetical protein
MLVKRRGLGLLLIHQLKNLQLMREVEFGSLRYWPRCPAAAWIFYRGEER